MTSPKQFTTPDAMLGRTPEFVRKQAARLKRAKTKSARRRKEIVHSLGETVAFSNLAKDLTTRIKHKVEDPEINRVEWKVGIAGSSSIPYNEFYLEWMRKPLKS